MALITLDFESEYMGSNQNVNIIMPDKPRDISCQQFYGNKKSIRFYGCYMGHLVDILTGYVKVILKRMHVKEKLLL